jgi:hypothetical protein
MNLVWYSAKDMEPSNMVPLEDMKHQWLYAGDGRNFSIGVWNAAKQEVEGRRSKWHDIFIDGEGHYGDGTGCFIPVIALEEVGPIWGDMREKDKLAFLKHRAEMLERLSYELDKENPKRLLKVWKEAV